MLLVPPPRPFLPPTSQPLAEQGRERAQGSRGWGRSLGAWGPQVLGFAGSRWGLDGGRASPGRPEGNPLGFGPSLGSGSLHPEPAPASGARPSGRPWLSQHQGGSQARPSPSSDLPGTRQGCMARCSQGPLGDSPCSRQGVWLGGQATCPADFHLTSAVALEESAGTEFDVCLPGSPRQPDSTAGASVPTGPHCVGHLPGFSHGRPVGGTTTCGGGVFVMPSQGLPRTDPFLQISPTQNAATSGASAGRSRAAAQTGPSGDTPPT